jgi:RNA ligase (TIGR02306 family)
LQGEIIGEGIQGNKYKLKGQTVFFFNAFQIDAYEYFGFEKFVDLMQKLNLNMVPVLNAGYKLEKDIPTLVNKATIRSGLREESWAEGIVIRPLTEKTDKIGRLSFKAINPEFLLKYGE